MYNNKWKVSLYMRKSMNTTKSHTFTNTLFLDELSLGLILFWLIVGDTSICWENVIKFHSASKRILYVYAQFTKWVHHGFLIKYKHNCIECKRSKKNNIIHILMINWTICLNGEPNELSFTFIYIMSVPY